MDPQHAARRRPPPHTHAYAQPLNLIGPSPPPFHPPRQLRDSRPATPASAARSGPPGSAARRAPGAAVVKVIPLARANNISIMLTQVGPV